MKMISKTENIDYPSNLAFDPSQDYIGIFLNHCISHGRGSLGLMYKYNLNKVVEEKISMINSPISQVNNVFILMFVVAIILIKKTAWPALFLIIKLKSNKFGFQSLADAMKETLPVLFFSLDRPVTEYQQKFFVVVSN